MSLQPEKGTVHFSAPYLPQSVKRVDLSRLVAGEKCIDFRVRRDGDAIVVETISSRGVEAIFPEV